MQKRDLMEIAKVFEITVQSRAGIRLSIFKALSNEIAELQRHL